MTLVATITVRYSGERQYYCDPGQPLPTNEQMAAMDQAQYDNHDVSPEDVLSWAAGDRDITIKIEAEA